MFFAAPSELTTLPLALLCTLRVARGQPGLGEGPACMQTSLFPAASKWK